VAVRRDGTQFVRDPPECAQSRVRHQTHLWRRGFVRGFLRQSCQTTMATRISTADATIRAREANARRVGDLVFKTSFMAMHRARQGMRRLGPPRDLSRAAVASSHAEREVARLACEYWPPRYLQYATSRHDVALTRLFRQRKLAPPQIVKRREQSSGVGIEVWLRRNPDNIMLVIVRDCALPML